MKIREIIVLLAGIALSSACSSRANDGTGGASSGETRASGGSSGSAGSGGQGSRGAGGSGGTPRRRGGGGTGGHGASHWVGTWTGAPQLVETANNPPAPLSNSTLRQVVHVSLGGSQIRLRFSNEFGNGPVTINQAHVAVCQANPVDSTI